MIISHAHKFIFIKTKKTAGTSLEIALSKYCGGGDILTPLMDHDERMRIGYAGRGARNFSKSFRQRTNPQRLRSVLGGNTYPRFHEHMAAVDVREAVGPEIWDSYFKFTVVRDPFDRCVSRYFWTLGRGQKGASKWKVDTFSRFVRYFPEYINENWNLYTSGDEILVNLIARYEDIDEALSGISRKLGLGGNLADDMRHISAKAGIRPDHIDYGALIEPRERATIANLCAGEIEAFGYSFEKFMAAKARAQAAPDTAMAG